LPKWLPETNPLETTAGVWIATGSQLSESEELWPSQGFGGVYLFGSRVDFLAANRGQFRQAYGSPRVIFRFPVSVDSFRTTWSLARQLTGEQLSVENIKLTKVRRMPTHVLEASNSLKPKSIFFLPVLRGGFRCISAVLASAREFS
jgi:hypothetical protein